MIQKYDYVNGVYFYKVRPDLGMEFFITIDPVNKKLKFYRDSTCHDFLAEMDLELTDQNFPVVEGIYPRFLKIVWYQAYTRFLKNDFPEHIGRYS